MKTITVDYVLSDAEYKRLERITDLFSRATGEQKTPESTFRALMVLCSKSDIASYMDYAEINFSANLKESA